jgi:hypothetical protein
MKLPFPFRPMLKPLILISSAWSLTALAAFSEDITFGPVRAQPGQKIHLVSQVDATEGTIERERDGKKEKGEIRFYRSRDLTWTFRAPAADGSRRGMVKVSSMNTETKVRIQGKDETTTEESPLNGRMISMTKLPTGDWTFDLDGSLQTLRIEREMAELTRYLKRKWYPEYAVKMGDSWEFDPVWIKGIVEKDLSQAQTIGTMRLRQIRHSAEGKTAVIAISIESTGGDFRPDGTEASAHMELKGEVAVNLQTMLEEKLTLSGTIDTRSGTVGSFVTTRVPIQLTVTKTFVRE